MKKVRLTWAALKTIVSAKSLNLQFEEEDTSYGIFAQEGVVIYETLIRKLSPASADQTDFENNFKSSANAAVQAMPVSANVTVSTERFRPAMAQTTTEVSLTNTYQTIMSITGNGKVDFVNLRFSKKNVELAVWVNGAESYILDLEELKSDHKLDDGVDEGHSVGVQESGKTFNEAFFPPVDFTSSFEIRAKKTGSNPKFVSGIIKHRIKI